MLLELFNEVRIKIAVQLCKTVLKLGKPRLNKIRVTLSRRVKPEF